MIQWHKLSELLPPPGVNVLWCRDSLTANSLPLMVVGEYLNFDNDPSVRTEGDLFYAPEGFSHWSNLPPCPEEVNKNTSPADFPKLTGIAIDSLISRAQKRFQDAEKYNNYASMASLASYIEGLEQAKTVAEKVSM